MYSYLATGYFLWKYSYLLSYLDYGFTAIRYGRKLKAYMVPEKNEDANWEIVDYDTAIFKLRKSIS